MKEAPVLSPVVKPSSTEIGAGIKHGETKQNNSSLIIQPKLTVGAPDDPYEKEADDVADKVMRMPERPFVPNLSTANATIQREGDEEINPPAKNQEKLQQQNAEPDFLSLRTPFFDRNVPQLWDVSSALGIWRYNFDFFKRFGLNENWAGKAANLTAPLFIDSQLKANNPKWWEITDRELNTTSIVGTLPLFNFDANFRNWKPLPFIQRKCAKCEEEKIQRQVTDEDEELVQPKLSSSFLNIQRKCEECKKEEEKPLQTKPLISSIQTKPVQSFSSQTGNIETSIEESKGNGSRMDMNTMSFMQSRFQRSFEDVAIHANSKATEMNRQLNAKAFTVGNNIFFNEGQYQPHINEGKTLLAHELTHVVQQNKSQPFTKSLQRKETQVNSTSTDTVCSSFQTPVTATVPGEESKITETPAEPLTQAKPESVKPVANKKPVTKKGAEPSDKAIVNPATTKSSDSNKEKKLPDDPAFDAVIKETHRKAKKQKEHEEPDKKVENAENAVKVKDEQAITSGATVLAVDEKVNQEKQKPKEFSANEFKQQLKEKISSGVPNEEESAKAFIKDDKQVNAITADTTNNVTKAQSEVVSDAKQIGSQTEADKASKDAIYTRPGTDYESEKAGAKPRILHAERAVPKPLDDDEVKMDEEHDADSLDRTMKENDLSDDQLAESEEPKFIDTLQEKQNSQKELCKIPGKLRNAEGVELQRSANAAQLMLNGGMNSMYAKRDNQFKSVEQGQHNVQSEEELKLQDYYNKIKLIYATTELNVKNSLNYLECIVSCTFEEAIAAAFETFKDHVTKRLDYYYDWHIINPDYEKEDKMTRAFVNAPLDEKIAALEYRKLFLPMNSPERLELQTKIDDLKSKRVKLKIELIFEEEKALFISTMDTAIDKIADMVAAGLNEAKTIISKGKAAVEEEYCCLDDANKTKAKETTDDFISKFSDLNDKVNDKEAELSDTLAKQYNETASKLKDTFETIRKEAALSWWEKAWRKIKEIALIIYDLGKTLLNILIKAASVVGDIIRHPIRFFENLIEGITRGFKNFVKRLPQHLEEIIFRLIMGVAPPEITLPAKWDVKGIFSFVLDILGLSKANIRKQAVDKFGEPVVQKLEQTLELFVIFKNEGFAGLWEYIKEKIGNLKDAIIEEIKTFFKESIIQAAVEFLISALTPASGFIKVCKSIISIVVFLVKNLQNLLKLLDNILDSLADIAVGKVDKAANKVENAITDILLVGIKFLAALVGINLDKIQAKISKIINAVRNPVNRALKWLFDKAQTFAERTGLLRLIRKGKQKFEAGKEWAKEKVEKGKEKVRSGVKKIISAFDWKRTKKTFKTTNGKNHLLYVEKRVGKPVVIVESDPTLLSSLLVQLRNKYKKDSAKLASIQRAEELLAVIDQYAVAIKNAEDKVKNITDETAKQTMQNQIEDAYDAMMVLETNLTTNLHEVLESEDYSELSDIYGVEGLVGVHADAPKRRSMFEADHQPSNKMIQTAADFSDAPPILRQIATNRSSWASTITLHRNRHVKGRTYGSKAKPIAREFVDDVKEVLKGESNQRDKRLFIEVLLQRQAKEDAEYMLNLVHGSPVENDLWSDINSQPNAKEFREKIVAQIERGESLIKNEKITIPPNVNV